MDFIAFDFETANHEKHSACSVALTFVENSQIKDEYYTLIKPETPFFWRNIQVHGIQEEDVALAPYFPEVWYHLKDYFTENQLIVAHNMNFDKSILAGCLDYYGMPNPHYKTLCTVQSSRKLLPASANHRLNTVCDYLNIPLENHHHALDDSNACAKILLNLEDQFGEQALKPFIKSI